jgi:hypothetical protein
VFGVCGSVECSLGEGFEYRSVGRKMFYAFKNVNHFTENKGVFNNRQKMFYS